MGKVLFVPLNSNQVSIFKEIIRHLQVQYEVLCHDRISEAEFFHTEPTMQRLGVPYSHFPRTIDRNPTAGLGRRVTDFLKMKRLIGHVLDHSHADLIVLGMDNDPIARVFIDESKKRKTRTLLVQDALIIPSEYNMRKMYASDYLLRTLGWFGIYLNYSQYGIGRCNWILVAGRTAMEILEKEGVPKERIAIVGYPQYDDHLKKISRAEFSPGQRKVYLYAPSAKAIHDDQHVQFLKTLVAATDRLGIRLIIKLHAGEPYEPSDIYEVLNAEASDRLKVLKQGEDAFEIMKRSHALITVSSTVVPHPCPDRGSSPRFLEALMLDKECIVVNYLVGEEHLECDRTDAIYPIQSEDEIFDVIKNSMLATKAYENKKLLLEDELYKLDGKAGERAAHFIESAVS